MIIAIVVIVTFIVVLQVMQIILYKATRWLKDPDNLYAKQPRYVRFITWQLEHIFEPVMNFFQRRGK